MSLNKDKKYMVIEYNAYWQYDGFNIFHTYEEALYRYNWLKSIGIENVDLLKIEYIK